jgi:predicted XRE-type DNA-binding protein
MKTKKRVSAPLTAELVRLIKEMAQSRSLAQHQIAAQLNINQGRVSETLRGRYDNLITS